MDWNHGGDWAGFELEYGVPPLDFSANVSPLGMPEGARQAAVRALGDASAYPDPGCRALRRALSAHHGVPADKILCGCGASDLIYRLVAALRPREALVTAPTFSEYEAALVLHGCRVRRVPLREEWDFVPEQSFPEWITPETDAAFLCSPNNPTGRTVPPALLGRILARCRETGTLLVLDACFADFLDAPEEQSLLRELRAGGLLILRAFTKFYGMAGLRLGYCLCEDEALLERMACSGPPWAVSCAAQAAGIAALEDAEYVRRLRELIIRERSAVAAGLTACGFRVIPGEANYLLFRSGDPGLGGRLRARGILIRDCRDFHGLGPGWYRTAVRTEAENQRLLETLQEVTA